MSSRVRVGFAGLHFPNFQAEEHRVYETSVEFLNGLSHELGFELIAHPRVMHEKAEAESAAGIFTQGEVDFLLLQASSFMLGDTIEPLGAACSRIGFWVVPEPKLTGELPLNSLTGFNMGVSILRKRFPERPVKWFYGKPEGDPEMTGRLRVTISALRALKGLRGAHVGLMHDVVPTFLNLTYDADRLRSRLGVAVEPIPLSDVFTRYESVAGQRKESDSPHPGSIPSPIRIEDEMRSTVAEVRVPQDELRKSAVITHAVMDVARDRGVSALAIRCWPEFQSVLHAAPCASVAYLNDHGLIASCEGDIPGAVSMLAAWHISGHAPTMNDPVAIDMEHDLVQMWHCGPGPASWADSSGRRLDWHHTLNRRVPEGEPKYGVSSDISFRKGEVTLLHVGGDASTLFVLQGEIVDGPSEPYPGSGGWLGNLTSNGEPVSAADFLENIVCYGMEHHYPIMRGHHEAAIREMATWAGIEVMEVHRSSVYARAYPGPPGGIRSDE